MFRQHFFKRKKVKKNPLTKAGYPSQPRVHQIPLSSHSSRHAWLSHFVVQEMSPDPPPPPLMLACFSCGKQIWWKFLKSLLSVVVQIPAVTAVCYFTIGNLCHGLSISFRSAMFLHPYDGPPSLPYHHHPLDPHGEQRATSHPVKAQFTVMATFTADSTLTSPPPPPSRHTHTTPSTTARNVGAWTFITVDV